MLVEIPLQAVPNQTITSTPNGQTLNISINALSVNNKPLQNYTANYEPSDMIIRDPQIGNTLVSQSSIFMIANIQVGNTPIIYDAFCNNATYLNFAPSILVGYLFFYIDNWQEVDNLVSYKNFGVGGNTHLYYSDYDALDTDFLFYLNSNKTYLLQKFSYAYTK